MIQLVDVIWSIVGGGAVALIWLIRLESKVLYLEKDHLKLVENSQKTDLLFQTRIEKLGQDLNEIRICLARIESRILVHHERPKDSLEG